MLSSIENKKIEFLNVNTFTGYYSIKCVQVEGLNLAACEFNPKYVAKYYPILEQEIVTEEYTILPFKFEYDRYLLNVANDLLMKKHFILL